MPQFQTGKSGNPSGRPKGSQNKRTVFEKLLLKHQDKLTKKAVDMALNGNEAMLRLVLERVLPAKPKGAPLPPIKIDDTNLTTKTDSIFKAITAGQISPEEAHTLFQLLKIRGELVEIVEIDRRLGVVEGKV